MPQTTLLFDWRVDYPLDAPAQKPGGVEVRKATAITAASWAANVTTYTATGHGIPIGSGVIVTVIGMLPVAFNGQFLGSAPTANTIAVSMLTTPGSATQMGTAYYMVLAANAVPNPSMVMSLAEEEKPKAKEEVDEEEQEDEDTEEEVEEEDEEEESTRPRSPRRRR